MDDVTYDLFSAVQIVDAETAFTFFEGIPINDAVNTEDDDDGYTAWTFISIIGIFIVILVIIWLIVKYRL